MNDKNAMTITPQELAKLIETISQNILKLNQFDALPNVKYDSSNAREVYWNAANGIFEGAIRVSAEVSLDCSKIKRLFEEARSDIAKAAALNVYKKARAMVHDTRLDSAVRESLYTALEEIKREYRNYGAHHDVVGNSENPNWWIYSYENGPMVREVAIKSKKMGMKPLEIVQFTDPHFNYCNEKDFAEANPALMSTHQHRWWLANGASVDVTRRSFDYAAMSDQTIVTGDILDYLSYGAQELTQKHLFWKDSNLLAAIGGHETTREMQGVVEDTTTEESRLEILKSFWCNDIFYESKILGDRVIAVVMDNGSHGTYTEDQFNRLKADLEYARQNDLIVLIFQHEPLCTANPAETDVPFVRPNDAGGSRNFFKDYVGGVWVRERLKDEWSMRTHDLIRQSADVIKGVFCGHRHSDFYTEILGMDQNGAPNQTVIPQYILTATVYDDLGHMMKITID